MIKQLQEAVKQQAQIIDDQAKQHKEEIEKFDKIAQLPWYKQLQEGQNLTTHSITTHVRIILQHSEGRIQTSVAFVQQ